MKMLQSHHIIKMKTILDSLKKKEVNFQCYLNITKVNNSIQCIIESYALSLQILKEKFDIMYNNKTRVSSLEGKKYDDLNNFELEVVNNWESFLIEVQKLETEQVEYQSPMNIEQFLEHFNTNNKQFTVEDYDILTAVLGL